MHNHKDYRAERANRFSLKVGVDTGVRLQVLNCLNVYKRTVFFLLDLP